MNIISLKGYRFDKSDKMGLKISFATNPKDNLKEKKRWYKDVY